MKKGLSKNKDRLDSFTDYCKHFPEQRFWQALRNWSAVEYAKEIKNADIPYPDFIFMGYDEEGIQDTFYLD